MSRSTRWIALATLGGGLLLAPWVHRQANLAATAYAIGGPSEPEPHAVPIPFKANQSPRSAQAASEPHSISTPALAMSPAWAWGVEHGDWKRLYATWSSWRKTQGPDAAPVREYVAYLASLPHTSEVEGAALAPAARAGDWEVLLTAFALKAPTDGAADAIAKLDVFMQQTLAQCGTEGSEATCSSPSFLAALNALAPSIAQSFVVRVVRDADTCGMPHDHALRPTVERVLNANGEAPWCL